MMPPYAALHTICSIDLASHSPQLSQAHMPMQQIRGMARSNSPSTKSKSANIFVILVEANPPNFPAIRYAITIMAWTTPLTAGQEQLLEFATMATSA